MTRRVTAGDWDRRRAADATMFGLVVIGYSVLAGFTRPFTVAADALTAFPLAIATVITVVRLRRRPSPPSSSGRQTEPLRRLVPWIVAVAVIAAWELSCFLSSPRPAHPTLSSLFDLLDSTQVGKTLAFALWLALGTYLVVS